MNTVVHLRKLCNHPFLFENVEDECREFWKVPDVSGLVFCLKFLMNIVNIYNFTNSVLIFESDVSEKICIV